mmetsp:Transcript_110584/g.308030  ORF Transcript_110584/g.308030 Transcript_110584/m.308030 type:complete len:265 (+) Transcript_110584:458-1252(+)
MPQRPAVRGAGGALVVILRRTSWPDCGCGEAPGTTGLCVTGVAAGLVLRACHLRTTVWKPCHSALSRLADSILLLREEPPDFGAHDVADGSPCSVVRCFSCWGAAFQQLGRRGSSANDMPSGLGCDGTNKAVTALLSLASADSAISRSACLVAVLQVALPASRPARVFASSAECEVRSEWPPAKGAIVALGPHTVSVRGLLPTGIAAAGTGDCAAGSAAAAAAAGTAGGAASGADSAADSAAFSTPGTLAGGIGGGIGGGGTGG